MHTGKHSTPELNSNPSPRLLKNLKINSWARVTLGHILKLILFLYFFFSFLFWNPEALKEGLSQSFGLKVLQFIVGLLYFNKRRSDEGLGSECAATCRRIASANL